VTDHYHEWVDRELMDEHTHHPERFARYVMQPKKTMKYTWMQTALENGGVMTASIALKGVVVTMNWRGYASISSEQCATIEDALQSLETALEDDAANEMQHN